MESFIKSFINIHFSNDCPKGEYPKMSRKKVLEKLSQTLHECCTNKLDTLLFVVQHDKEIATEDVEYFTFKAEILPSESQNTK